MTSQIEHIRVQDAPSQNAPKRTGFMGKLGDLVRKAVDCCIE